MPASSIFKFMGNNGHSNGHGVLHWGRADVDGAPFRGQAPPPMTEEEADERLVRAYDPQNRYFDTSDPVQNKAYLKVLDMVTNGWAQVLNREIVKVPVERIYKQEDGSQRVEHDVVFKVYLEWVVPVMIDGKPFHSQRPYTDRSSDD